MAGEKFEGTGALRSETGRDQQSKLHIYRPEDQALKTKPALLKPIMPAIEYAMLASLAKNTGKEPMTAEELDKATEKALNKAFRTKFKRGTYYYETNEARHELRLGKCLDTTLIQSSDDGDPTKMNLTTSRFQITDAGLQYLHNLDPQQIADDQLKYMTESQRKDVEGKGR